MALITKLELMLMERGFPKRWIAEAAGMKPPRISEYVSGLRQIPTHHLLALSEVLKCSPDDLVGMVDVGEAPDRGYKY